MEKLTGKQLAIMAAKARLLGLDAVHTAASGHIGGSLSIIDALTTLYFNVMNVDPADPKNPDRDRFVLSKGHTTPALYPFSPSVATSPRKISSSSAPLRVITPVTQRCAMSTVLICPPVPWVRVCPLLWAWHWQAR